MIQNKQRGFRRSYAYGGAGIFDTIANFLSKVFSSPAMGKIASSAADVGKAMAKEGAKKALDLGKNVVFDGGKTLLRKALTPKSKKILDRNLNAPAKEQKNVQSVSAMIEGSGDVMRVIQKLNAKKKGKGIKTI